MKLMPIRQIKKWRSDKELLEHCEHIVSHAERYVPARVFVAKEIINNFRNKEYTNGKAFCAG
jgi:hypothetical protein